MNFVFRMALREIRSSWRKLIFFLLCIGFGVASIVALRSVIRHANDAVTGEARLIFTADVQIDSTRPWAPETLAVIEHLAQPPLVESTTETIEVNTMARPADSKHEGAMMVELKGIEPAFPLYGEFKMADNKPFDFSLVAGSGAVVAPLLLERLNLGIGDEIKIGDSTFQIRGVFNQEPGAGGGGFRLGPRVFVERAAVDNSGLASFGSRARRRILFKTFPGDMEELVETLRGDLRNKLVNVRSYKDSQENMSEQFARAENYLSLTGLVVLVLGGVGVSSVTRVFLEQKRKAIAVLKCLGGTGWQITAVYFSQVITLGAAGSIFGLALAKAALLTTQRYFSESLPANMSYGLTASAVLQGIALGLLISTLFSVLPLLRIRHVKPSMLLREESAGPTRTRLDVVRLLAACLILLCLMATASWQAGSIQVGAFFLGGLGVATGALYLAALLLMFLMRRARHFGPFALKHAINGLFRPGNQTRVTVVAVGLGVFLVLTTQLLRSNLLHEFDQLRNGNLPNMFLIDIQKDQGEGVQQLIAQSTGRQTMLIPTVRARIVGINGNVIDLDSGALKTERGRLGREYVVTYRPELDANESIVAGRFWDDSPATEPEVSIEEGMRGLAGLDIGSTITFDILGRKFTARVTSIRHVDWRNSRTGFMVLFRPGALEDAPQTFVAAIDGPPSEPERSRFQRALLDRYPNISVIDVADIMRSVTRILDNVTLSVTFLAGFVLVSGMMILAGSVAMTKFQRIYEVAVLRTLGAKQKVTWVVLLTEYGLLGSVSGIIGSLAAVGLSYAISRFVFKIDWAFAPAIGIGGIGATILLVVSVGALSSIQALRGKPLTILRNE